MKNEEKMLSEIICALVQHPEDIVIERTTDDKGVLLTLHAHAEDMGRIIGREGNIAKAIRTIIRAVGARNQAAVSIRIAEPEGSTRPARPLRMNDGFEEGFARLKYQVGGGDA